MAHLARSLESHIGRPGLCRFLYNSEALPPLISRQSIVVFDCHALAVAINQ